MNKIMLEFTLHCAWANLYSEWIGQGKLYSGGEYVHILGQRTVSIDMQEGELSSGTWITF